MSKISNVLTMLQLLQNGRKYNSKELADKLEVSERMVRIYKEELEKAGIFIETLMGPYGGYVLNQSVKMPVRNFSNSDYLFLHNLNVSNSDKEQLELIADKVRGLLYTFENENIELKNDIKNYYNILNKAINENRKVKINYYSFRNGNLDRIIRPYNMYLYSNGWGCAAFCELRNDLRHFELKRINSIELLNEYF